MQISTQWKLCFSVLVKAKMDMSASFDTCNAQKLDHLPSAICFFLAPNLVLYWASTLSLSPIRHIIKKVSPHIHRHHGWSRSGFEGQLSFVDLATFQVWMMPFQDWHHCFCWLHHEIRPRRHERSARIQISQRLMVTPSLPADWGLWTECMSGDYMKRSQLNTRPLQSDSRRSWLWLATPCTKSTAQAARVFTEFTPWTSQFRSLTQLLRSSGTSVAVLKSLMRVAPMMHSTRVPSTIAWHQLRQSQTLRYL